MPKRSAHSRKLAALLGFAALAPPLARAQLVAGYGTFSLLHADNVQSGTTFSANNTPPPQTLTTSLWAPGFGGGVTVRIIAIGPVSLAADLRGSYKPGTPAPPGSHGTPGAETAFFGIKAGFRPPLLHLKAYVQGSGGYLATRTFNATIYLDNHPPGSPPQPYKNDFAAYEILGGVDRAIFPFVDLRIIEIGGGKAFSLDHTADFGATPQTPNPSLFTLNTGVVFHF